MLELDLIFEYDLSCIVVEFNLHYQHSYIQETSPEFEKTAAVCEPFIEIESGRWRVLAPSNSTIQSFRYRPLKNELLPAKL